MTFTNEEEPILFQATFEVKTSSCFRLIEAFGNGLFQKKPKQREGVEVMEYPGVSKK